MHQTHKFCLGDVKGGLGGNSYFLIPNS
jgi:hypothetical protein